MNVIATISKQLAEIAASLKKQVAEKIELQQSHSKLKEQSDDMWNEIERWKLKTNELQAKLEAKEHESNDSASRQEFFQLQSQIQQLHHEKERLEEKNRQDRTDAERSKKLLEEALLEVHSQLQNTENGDLTEKILQLEGALVELEDENRRLRGGSADFGSITPSSSFGRSPALSRSRSLNTNGVENGKGNGYANGTFNGITPQSSRSFHFVEEDADVIITDENQGSPRVEQPDDESDGESSVSSLPIDVPETGDEVSEALAEVIKKRPEIKDLLPANAARLGSGVYQFGTKKIIVKRIDREVFVRVGGGYMTFEKYVQDKHREDQSGSLKKKLKETKEPKISENLHSLTVFPAEIQRMSKQQREGTV
eukprot:TRINITY_DN4770_c0_g1_i2.p1 TRINITY_DN4770_c0_g1~~TRINITY_DN4770_c0_g1_i2.p1  ORF type:complete len:368 (-),score=158.94 TRINITY_DN4770_c0_g1_i2:27-1130(-)